MKKVLIIGYGSAGRRHAKILKNILKTLRCLFSLNKKLKQ